MDFKAEKLKSIIQKGFFVVHMDTQTTTVQLNVGDFSQFIGKRTVIRMISEIAGYSGADTYSLIIKTGLCSPHSSYHSTSVTTRQGNIMGVLFYHSYDADGAKYVYISYETPEFETIFRDQFEITVETERQESLTGNLNMTLTFSVKTLE